MRQAWTITHIFLLFMAVGCAGGSLTTREKGAGIGASGGAAVGGNRSSLFLQTEIERLKKVV